MTTKKQFIFYYNLIWLFLHRFNICIYTINKGLNEIKRMLYYNIILFQIENNKKKKKKVNKIGYNKVYTQYLYNFDLNFFLISNIK